MVWNYQGTNCARHLWSPLLRLRVRIRRGQTQRACRRCGQTKFRSPSDTSIRVDISAKAPEGIGCSIDQSGKVKNDYPLQLGIEVGRRKPQPVLIECLIDARIEGYRAIGFQTGISKHRVAKEAIERTTESFKKRRRPVAITDMAPNLCSRR